MLLSVNIGNSSIRFGVFNGSECSSHWIIQSKPHKSADEYIYIIHSLLNEHGIDKGQIKRITAASVVPELNGELKTAFFELFGCNPTFIDYRMKTGLLYPIEEPKELGADLLANAAAAVNLYKRDVVVIDFGTALSFTIVRESGLLAGIVIAPGVISALGSLVQDTAQLPAIEIKEPERVVGVDTIGCIQSGLVHGYTGLFENIVKKIDEEQGTESLVVSTGGTAHIFEKISDVIDIYDDLHTLKGLQIIDQLNTAV